MSLACVITRPKQLVLEWRRRNEISMVLFIIYLFYWVKF
jgi:hypothetical protein